MARPYSASLIRLIHGDTNPQGPGYLDEPVSAAFAGQYQGYRQDIHAGSFGIVEGTGPLGQLLSFTLCVLIQPTQPGSRDQVILSHWDGARGFELLMDASGAAAIRVGDGNQIVTLSTGMALQKSAWYFVSASYDEGTGALFIRQTAVHLETLATRLHAASAGGRASFLPTLKAPLMFAATPGGRTAMGQSYGQSHFNGKVEAPRIYSSALGDDALGQIAQTEACHPDLVAAWDFSEAIATDMVRDVSGNDLHGHVVNMPTRAVTGHSWTGEEMNWSRLPEHYGAIHFHDDDLYDAAWVPSFNWTVPTDLQSGLYCVHLSDGEAQDYIPLVVRPPAGRPSARLALLLPTASYMAYGNERCGLDADGGPLFEAVRLHAHDHFLSAHPEYGMSLYDRHSDESGAFYASRLRPLVNMRPKLRTWLGGQGSAVWGFNADTHILHFLESQGIAYDILTDEDLDREGIGALEGYACVMTGTHPEYWSTKMLDALDGFKAQAGRIIYMGGNGFYWRAAFHPTLPGIIEVRRAEGGIRPWAPAPGEYYHSFSGELGGLWQRLGRAPQSIVGVGMTSQGFDRSGYFRRTAQSYKMRVAFAFLGVEDEIVGNFGLVGGGAAGSEIDRADTKWGTPSHALVVARSENHSSAYLMTPEDINEPTAKVSGPGHPLIHADMTFFETPSGGAVFSMSSIAWAGSLSHNGFDNNVAQITRNVVARFLDETPFETP
ncbi:MAG TPA: N,N-dimethylformamidase beta subunit family domain-containing protein [Sphingobium sp.]